MEDKKSVTKSAGIIGSATVLSRILGFVRDVMIAAFFGTGIYAQAFVVAFRIPNMLRSVVGEGSTNSVVVPVLSEYISTRSRQEYWKLATNLIMIMAAILVVITVGGILLAPYIVRVIAPGFVDNPQKFSITISLTKFMFPYIFFIGLTSIGIGILNSFKYFKIPSLSQPTFNFLFISTVSVLYFFFDMGVYSLAVGVLVGGIGQMIIQLPSLVHFGLKKPSRIFYIHPAMKKIVKLFLPRLLGAGVYQINVFVDTMLSSLAYIVGKGGVAALYYSNRLVQLPLAVFGISLAQAVLPTFSRQSLEKGLKEFKKTLSFSLKNIFFITIPAILGLLILRIPIIKILFQRGQFDEYSVSITSYTLVFYVLGLFAYAGIKILVSSFYSLKDTFTPVKVASFSVAVNIVLNLILMYPLEIGGIALATSISATINFLILYYILRKKIGKILKSDFIITFFKTLFSAAVMAGVCYVFYYHLFNKIWALKESFLLNCISLLITIFVAILTYFGICALLGMPEVENFIQFFKPKTGSKDEK